MSILPEFTSSFVIMAQWGVIGVSAWLYPFWGSDLGPYGTWRSAKNWVG